MFGKMGQVRGIRSAFSHKEGVDPMPALVARRALLDLEELPLDCPHSRHQPVEFGKELLLVLPGLLDQLR